MSNDQEKTKPTLLTIKRRLHGMRRIFFLSLALMIAVAGYFHFIGLPQWAVRMLERHLAERHLYVSIENVKLDFYYGLEAQQVTVYKTILERTPLLKADSMAAYISARELFGNGQWLARVHLGDARILPALLPQEAGEFFPAPVIKGLDANWMTGRLVVQRSDLRWGKLRIHAAGDLFYDQESIDPSRSKEPAAPSDALRLILEGLHQSVRLKDAAEMDLQFSLNTILPERSAFTARLDGGRLWVRDLFFTDLNLAVSMTSELLSLESLELKKGLDVLQVSGAVELDDFRTALKINNTLDIQDLALMHSLERAKTLADENLGFKEGFQLTLQTGADDWLARQDVSGTLFAKSVSLRGVPFQNIYGSFTHADGVLDVSRLRAYIPAGVVGDAEAPRRVAGGEFSAEGRLDRKTKAYRVRTVAGFDPWLILPLLAATPIEGIVRNHAFYDEVALTVSVTGDGDDPRSHAVVGRVVAGPSARKGAAVDSVLCDFTYKDALLTLPAIHVEKDGAASDAMVMINFSTKMIDLEYEGGLDPTIVARMIHPMLEGPVSKFTFNGANAVRCRGAFDYGGHSKTTLAGSFSGTAVRSPVAELETVAFDFGMTGPELYFTNVSAQVYGGMCRGTGSFMLNGAGTKPYRAAVEVAEVDMTELARFYGETGAAKQLGTLTGRVRLEGELGQPIGQNMRGAGEARLEKGWLVELPVLKSFTQVARLVFSQFSTFSQTDCTMDFEIRDGAVHTDNLVLEGDLMTLNGTGRYSFMSGFDANVEMKPFRKNKLTRVVQWASTPLSELLKFSVQGPLSNPTWRLARFPDVSSMFKRNADEAAENQ